MLLSRRWLYGVFAFVFLINIGMWGVARHWQARWANVPPVPGEVGLLASGLGDRQLAYRSSALVIQNLGDTGGRSTALKLYDYNALGGWFRVMDRMDPVSDYMPFLAAYYFGATQDATQLGPVIDYLEQAGNSPLGEKWRWMAQAVYLARHRQNDLPRAQRLARKLSVINNPKIPGWARQMPAMLSLNMGDKEMAYRIMMSVIAAEKDRLSAVELGYMQEIVCTKILDSVQAKAEPLCSVSLPKR